MIDQRAGLLQEEGVFVALGREDLGGQERLAGDQVVEFGLRVVDAVGEHVAATERVVGRAARRSKLEFAIAGQAQHGRVRAEGTGDAQVAAQRDADAVVVNGERHGPGVANRRAELEPLDNLVIAELLDRRQGCLVGLVKRDGVGVLGVAFELHALVSFGQAAPAPSNWET